MGCNTKKLKFQSAYPNILTLFGIIMIVHFLSSSCVRKVSRALAFSIAASVAFANPLPQVEVSCPDELDNLVFAFLDDHSTTPIPEVVRGLRKHLIDLGFPFVQVLSVGSNSNPEIVVKSGVMGKAKTSGNEYLSETGILKKLSWDSGKPFNYGQFQSSAARLNAYRFVQVDAKLAPVRSPGGDIVVNADLSVEDSIPLTYNLGLSNDGTTNSSGWRGKAGIELMEAFSPFGSLGAVFQFDPYEFGNFKSYTLQYSHQADQLTSSIYTGFSDSEYDEIIPTQDFEIIGNGFHLGYSGSFSFEQEKVDDFALAWGVMYLNLSNEVNFSGVPVSDEDLTLIIPRLGLRGSFSHPFENGGRSYWSVGAFSDLSTSDNSELEAQREGVEKGFFGAQLSFTSFQPIEWSFLNGGLQFKYGIQFSPDALPLTMQKSLGGMHSMRGYEEREAYGDRGFNFTVEYRLNPTEADLLGLKGRFQPLFFYDTGGLESHTDSDLFDSQTELETYENSISMQSLGAGVLGNFNGVADLNFQVGVPLNATSTTSKYSPRVHLGLNLRF